MRSVQTVDKDLFSRCCPPPQPDQPRLQKPPQTGDESYRAPSKNSWKNTPPKPNEEDEVQLWVDAARRLTVISDASFHMVPHNLDCKDS